MSCDGLLRHSGAKKMKRCAPIFPFYSFGSGDASIAENAVSRFALLAARVFPLLLRRLTTSLSKILATWYAGSGSEKRASMHLPLRPIHLACCLSDYLVQSVQTLKCGSAGSCLLSRLYVLSKGLSLTNVMAEHLSSVVIRVLCPLCVGVRTLTA
jgi:hypothetical protein